MAMTKAEKTQLQTLHDRIIGLTSKLEGIKFVVPVLVATNAVLVAVGISVVAVLITILIDKM